MADRYCVGAGNWDGAIWATTSNGTPNAAVPTYSDDVYFDQYSGDVPVNVTANCKNLTQLAGYTGKILHNNSTLLNARGNVTFISGGYVASVAGAILYFSSTAPTLITGGNAIPNIVYEWGGTLSLGDNATGIALKTVYVKLATNCSLNLNGKTISGNSATNRLLIYSNTVGTPRTITVNGGTFANCDFQDIAFANGGADLDLSAITGGSGNCGGNSMSGGGALTFTAPTTQTFASTGGNWSDSAKWTSRVPLPQDLARFQPMSAGQTITIDIPRIGDIDFNGCGSTNKPAVTFSVANTFYGSVNLSGAGTITWSTGFCTFGARSNASLTSAGNNIFSPIVAMPGATLTLNDAFLSGNTLSFRYGTIRSAYNITIARFSQYVGTTLTGTAAGSIVITITSSGDVWEAAGTVTSDTVSVVLSYAGASACAFNGGTNIYNDIQISPGSGVLTFSGAFTFHDMTMSSAGTRSVVFTKATTYTQTGDTFLSGAGVDDAPIITPSLLNGGFETAGAGGADVFANWIESVTGASTITDDITTPYSGGHACKLTCDATGNYVRIIQTALTTGKLYRIEFYAKSDTGATLLIYQSSDTALVTWVPVLSNVWAKYTVYGVQPGNSSFTFRINEANKNVYLDDITVTPLNSVLIQSSGAGEPFTLSKASGLIASNYLAIKDCIATGGAVWLAGYNSTNISGNTGWHFNSPATGVGSITVTGAGVAKALCNANPADATFTVVASALSKVFANGVPIDAEIIFDASAQAMVIAMAEASASIDFIANVISTVAATAIPEDGTIHITGSAISHVIATGVPDDGEVEFDATVLPTIAVWNENNFFETYNRRIGTFFNASSRRK